MSALMSEKTPLYLPFTNNPQLAASETIRHRHRLPPFWALYLSLVSFWWFAPSIIENYVSKGKHGTHPDVGLTCPQVDPLLPKLQTPELIGMDTMYSSESFEKLSIGRLSGAVKIPTISYDDLGEIGEDKRWDIMYDFAKYLNITFPLTFEKLEVETINTHGLLLTWPGSDASLKPTLLMAHQDVVPVAEATLDSWTHPPFDAVYDGKYIWGRGSSDCKNQLIGIMEAVESLLGANFEPRRTVILSFGFDEEISGKQGAGHLAPYLLEKYGPDSLAVLVDEGNSVSSSWGQIFAAPGVGEKGYIDVTVTVRMPGGHSSIPPPHTGIGVLSELITMIEADTYPTWLDNDNPYLHLMQCGSEWAPAFPKKLKKLLPKARGSKSKPDYLAIEAAKAGPFEKYLMQTSIAADIISGGVKINALPERSSVMVNHRINVGEHPSDIREKLAHIAKKVAEKHNLTVHAFDGVETPSSIVLTESNNTLVPAPVTPTSVDTISAYGVLSGTTRALYGSDIIMAPGMMTGNTDTRYYWDLTKNIFRYGPGWEVGEKGLGNIHTVDERVSVKAHIAGVKWFSSFIRNMDESLLA